MPSSTGRPITSDDLFRARWIDEPRLTADGRRVAFSMTGLDRARDATVSWISCDGHLREGASPRWAPDGAQLAFVSTGSGRSWLNLWAGDGSISRVVCAHPEPITQPCWSPDGGRIAFVAGQRLWVVGREGGERPLTDAGLSVESPVWLPDGRTIACVSNGPSGVSAVIWLVAVEGDRAPVRTLTFGGPIRALASAPDGRDLAFIAHDRGIAQGVNFGVFRFALDGGTVARLMTAGLDRSAGLSVRADDARGMAPPDLRWVDHNGQGRIYFIYCEGGSSHIAWVAEEGQVHRVVGGERACLSFDVAQGADALVFVATDLRQPGEVFLADRDGAGERAVTDVNGPWLAGLTLEAPRRLAVLSDDGQAIDAWLYAPLGHGAPLILQIHGGPHYAIGNRFYFEFHRLAALGYAVVISNPRGSQGYGEAFATCIRGAWGDRDYADLMSVLAAAIADPGVDPERLAVTGVSYGAFLTHLIVGRTKRFRAAVTENGISNLVSNFAGTTGQAFWTWQMFGTPESQPERYRGLSPITYADAIDTPLLMIHAEQDTNCPIGQSEELLAALRARGGVAELVRIPGEGHLMNLIGTPRHRLLRSAALDAWLARWLAPAPAEAN